MGVHDLCDSDIGGLEGAKGSLASVVSIATSTNVRVLKLSSYVQLLHDEFLI